MHLFSVCGSVPFGVKMLLPDNTIYVDEFTSSHKISIGDDAALGCPVVFMTWLSPETQSHQEGALRQLAEANIGAVSHLATEQVVDPFGVELHPPHQCMIALTPYVVQDGTIAIAVAIVGIDM
jgi:hypothetical protein